MLIAALAFPAGAVKRVRVAQLEQTLAEVTAEHRADADVARQIGAIELSERLTAATLDRWAGKLAMGPRTALALQLLADQSAFLDPPASELPATAPPDAATQDRLMDAARGYVIKTVPHLPNFFATRTTNRFDDAPHVVEQGGWAVRAGLQLTGTTTRQITFRDGKEVQDTVAEASTASAAPQAAQELGLHTWGEFGPELSIVLSDISKGRASFSHWEQTPAGLAAVFQYSVPRAASHYAVNYCCIREGTASERPGGNGTRGRAGADTPYLAPNVSYHPFSETPGYRGSLSIDPATGAILRIALEAELSHDDPLLRAATVVEYGLVAIGDRSYICPVRSLALSMEQSAAGGSGSGTGNGGNNATDPAWGSPSIRPAGTPLLLVNETSFTKYHRLGASVRLIADTGQPGASDQPAPGAAAPDAAASGSGSPPPGAPVAANATAPAPAATAPASEPIAAPVAAAPPAPPPAPATPAIPEVSLTEATGLPDEPSNPVANAPAQQEGGYSLKVTSRLVDVGLVAYDKKGHPVTDLKREELEVYDNGRKQEIRFFSQFGGEATPAAATSAPDRSAPPETFSNRRGDPVSAAAASQSPETNLTILLIDENHIAWSDMSHARQEIVRFLGTVAPGERVGLYTMTDLSFRVLEEITTDHAELIAKLQKWQPSARSATLAQEEETRNRQSFSEVHNVSDLSSVNGNQVDAPDGDSPVDPALRALGSNPARQSLIILKGVARHLAAVSGRKNLVWISSDNVFADWQNQAVSVERGPKSIDSFALHAQEAMNDAHVAVFPMDVSQLEGAVINADIRTRNVELTQAAADTASLGGGAVGRNMTPGRATAEMQQDLHPIQEPVMQVAAATGGRTIRRAGDLAAALAGVVEDGHATYLLSFNPDVPADDLYHNITVKLAGRHGVTLRYRTGYLYVKEPATLRDRFQQAIWQPMDASEIAVTADVAPMSPGANVKIDIAANDLGLQQQAGRWMDKLDVFFIERDDAGLHAQVSGQTMGLRLKSSTYQNLISGGVPFEHFVQLKHGAGSLRVLVVDENTGRMGSVTIPATALGTAQEARP
jgi:VWFA-related protein